MSAEMRAERIVRIEDLADARIKDVLPAKGGKSLGGIGGSSRRQVRNGIGKGIRERCSVGI